MERTFDLKAYVRRLALAAAFATIVLSLLIPVSAPAARAPVKPEWVDTLTGTPGGPYGAEYSDTAATPTGTVYASGLADLSARGGEGIVVKYDRYGERLWVRSWRPAADNSYAVFRRVRCDLSGNAYAAGLAFSGDSEITSLVIAKYAADGQLLWLHQFTPADGDLGGVADLAVTAGGDAYALVSGYPNGSTGCVWATIKYDAAGNQSWIAQEDWPRSGSPRALALDAAGNVYVTGSVWFAGSPYSTQECVTIKYASDGSREWSQRYLAPSRLQSFAETIAARGGTVTVVGKSFAAWPGQTENGFVLRYGADGSQQWVTAWTAPDGQETSYAGLVVDPAGDSYTCVCYTPEGVSDFGIADTSAILKLDPSGSPLWATPVRLGTNVDLRLIGLDTDGNLAAIGQARKAGFDRIAVAKLDSAGTVLRTAMYGPRKRHAYSSYTAEAGVTWSNDQLFVAGWASRYRTGAPAALMMGFGF